MKSFVKAPRIQGQDSILIDAAIETVWPLIHDSMELERWGPPVEKVELRLLPHQLEEGLGSERKVFAKFTEKRIGWYEEVRTEQVAGKSISFLIYQDSFGMSKMLSDVGGKMEVEKVGEQTKFTFTFYHRPKNLLGWLMNPMIKKDQKKNRRQALQSFKSYVESGNPIKNW